MGAKGISSDVTLTLSLSQIPPELTNRYVKNEAFIVVVFNDFLTLLPTTTMTILLLLLLLLSTSFSPNWLRSQLAPSCQLSMWQGIFHQHWNISIFLYLSIGISCSSSL